MQTDFIICPIAMGQIITPMIQKPEKSEDNKQISLMMNDTNGVRHDHH